MKLSKFFLFAAACLTISSSFVGCGSSDDDVVARVIDIFLDDRNLNTGQNTVLRTQFTFSDDRVFGDDDDIFLVIRIPSNVSFREDSAEIQRRFDDEDVSPLVTDCGEGQETYLRFKFDDEDLSGALNPDGPADAELALTLDAVSAAEVIVISAAAGDQEVPFGCGQPFLSDRETSLQIS